ncbi:MAG TPA: SLBB domain-containing protein [Micropepsaceae bacterium]|nr:SLBB domain-containing protein [Micropepsaceae bacterium]
MTFRHAFGRKHNRLATLFVAACAALLLGEPTAAQVPQNLQNDPLAQEVLRQLQQQRTGAVPDVTQIQPNTEIRNPPLYRPDLSPAQITPPNPQAQQGQQLPQAAPAPLSGLERVIADRIGQVVRQFGYDVFGRAGTVVVHQSGALQDNYVLGQGDEIVVTLRGQQNIVYRTRVDRDGRVVLQGLPPLSAAGRRFGDFRADLEGAVARAYTGTDVFVSIGEVRQISVRVVGEVNAPGAYSLTALSTALDALSLAGGIKNSGSLRNVQIIRGGRPAPLDLYNLLATPAANPDVSLTEGDQIVVPLEGPAVTIVGQVKRPAIYELPVGETRISVPDLVAMAGGLEIRGTYRYSVLRTRDDGRREFVEVPASATVSVQDGEVLFVNPAVDVSLAQVQLMGTVKLQGYYSLTDTPTLKALLRSAELFSPGPGTPLSYMLLAAVIRLDANALQRVVIPFSPVDVISGKADLPLQSNDIVYILNYREMRYVAQAAAVTQETPARRIVEESATAAGNGTNLGPVPGANGANIANGANGTTIVSPGTPQLPPANPSTTFGSGNPTLPVILPTQPQAQAGPVTIGGQPINPTQNQNQAPQNALAQPFPVDTFVGLLDDEKQLVSTALGHYYVSVLGAVNNPGAYLAAPGTTLDKVVQAAGGVTPRIDLNAFEITSADIDNGTGVSRTIRQVYKLGLNQFTQVSLRPYDRIRFNEVYSDRDDGEVSILGEIRFPGNYEILRGERLSSVLNRAGGLTDASYPYGAVFLRRSVAAQEREVLQHQADQIESQLIALVGTLTTKEQVSEPELQYVQRLTDRLRQAEGPGGRIAVQIDPARLAANPELDIVLEPGDRLFIPRRPSSVIVAGEVMSPSGIQYRSGLKVKDYLALAGGTTQIADDDHIFIIQPDGSAVRVGGGSIFSYSAEAELVPGSVIVVPRELRPPNLGEIFTNIVQVTSQLAITAASLAVISR